MIEIPQNVFCFYHKQLRIRCTNSCINRIITLGKLLDVSIPLFPLLNGVPNFCTRRRLFRFTEFLSLVVHVLFL